MHTHTDDALGCGDPGVFELVQRVLTRLFEALKFQETTFTHVGMEMAQAEESSVMAS